MPVVVEWLPKQIVDRMNSKKQKDEKRAERLIAFRPRLTLASRFERLVDCLEIDRTELAEEAVEIGLEKAARRIAARAKKSAESALRQLSLESTSQMSEAFSYGMPVVPSTELACA